MTFSKGWLKSPLLKASENEASNAQPNRVLAPSKVKGISKKRQPDKASLEGQMVKDMSGGEKGRRVSKSGVNGRGKKQGGDNIAQDQSDRGSQAGKAKRGRRGGSSQQGNGVEEEEEDSRAGLEWGEKETNAQGTDEGADEEEEDDEGDNDDSGPGVRSGKANTLRVEQAVYEEVVMRWRTVQAAGSAIRRRPERKGFACIAKRRRVLEVQQ